MTETLAVLLPLGIALLGIAIGFLLWAAHSGQFDDLDSPAYRILDDNPADDPKNPP